MQQSSYVLSTSRSCKSCIQRHILTRPTRILTAPKEVQESFICLDHQNRSIESKTHKLVQGLSTSSLHSAATFPELRPPILPNDPIADKLLKLLLPSLKFDFLDLLGLEGLVSTSLSLLVLIFATTNWLILLRQKGHTGAAAQVVVGFGFLWQHNARMQWAHI